ncbi:MAG TPA: helix-turn-helix domain-containing protein [Actinomycetota bacterium]|nr:helix-turn-helix domain-containing protein [Actinomycetota bacterium]
MSLERKSSRTLVVEPAAMGDRGYDEGVPEDSLNSALAAALAKIGDRWSLLVINALLDGPRRFNELADEVRGIAPNVLSARLRHLEDDGIVIVRPYSRRPPRSDYQLSASGKELAGALQLLARWGSEQPGAGDIRHQACGTPLDVRWFCPTCARIVEDPEDAGLRLL